jgi:two-component system sensor histidine kinase KdpD
MVQKTTAEDRTARQKAMHHEGMGESPKIRGRLKIFLSYAPGTGKTLAMLEDAYRRLQEGVDVVAGFVRPGEDALANMLLQKFETLPHHVVSSAGISYQGMDIDRLLDRLPQVVLVDDLARSNPPGLRHVARYLEVNELLDAGIDVLCTLNVYQIESQVDAVASLTGVEVRDTIPDSLADRADQVVMVDMPPQALLNRYSAGELAFPPRARMRIEKFFQPGNLFALRELALRYVARRSNAFMQSFLQRRDAPEQEAGSARLLVCISGSPEAQRLVRAGRRMADETHSEWTVLHIETPEQVEHGEEKSPALLQNMRLAEMLGANSETITGISVSAAVREYALRHHIQRIMVGRSSRASWQRLMGASLAESLLRSDPTISVYVVGGDHTPRPFQLPPFFRWFSRLQLLASLGAVAVPTLLGMALSPTIISRSANLVMLYLISVVFTSFFLGPLPALLTALLSVLTFDFFFIPPLHRFFAFAPEYAFTFAGLIIVSLMISTLVSRERTMALAARRRADQVTQLYELSRDLSIAVDMEDVLNTVLQHIHATFERDTVILLPKNRQLVLSASNAAQALDSSEMTAAEWAFQQGRPAGNNTGTFSYASFRYFPLETSRGIIGVIGVDMTDRLPELHPEEMRQLGTYVTKAATSIERALFAEEASQAEILRATEKLQTALLNSISHDLRTPLASITGVLDSLRMDEGFLDADTRRELVETAYGEAERLNRLVGNLLDMSRLESGTLRISLQPAEIQDLVGAALNALTARLEGHPIHVNIPADLPLVPMDYVLVNQVLINLLDNASKYSPENGAIEISASAVAGSGSSEGAVQVSVDDSGPGIPVEDLERIFEKFYRVKRFENVVGTGLGLSICKGIVEVHGGKIWAENRPEGGVRMAFILPVNPSRLAAQKIVEEPLQEEMRT